MFSPSFYFGFLVNRLGNTHDTGASTPSRIRIIPGTGCCEPTLLNGLPVSRQTAGGLKLTSGSGEQTLFEATFRFNKEEKNFCLIDT